MSPIEYMEATKTKTADASADLLVAINALPSEYRLRVLQRSAAFERQWGAARKAAFVAGILLGAAVVALLWWLK